MTLIFKSSTPERFEIRAIDSNGRARVAVATRESNAFNWDMRLTHPSGRHWPASYHGEAVLDALGALIESKHPEYVAEKGRGYRQEPAMRDPNHRLPESGDEAPIVRTDRYNVPTRRG